MDVEQLGAVRSRHRTSIRPLLTVGLALALLGTGLFVALAVINALAPDSVQPRDTVIEVDPAGTTAGMRPGSWGVGILLVIFGVTALVPGLLAVIRALHRGPGAYLEVRERGLVWGSKRRSTGRAWDEVRWIDPPKKKPLVESIATRMGLQSRCVVVFHDGTRLAFDSSTEDTAALIAAIRRHSPQAKALPMNERGSYRYRFVWLAGGVLSLAGIAGVWWHMDSAGQSDTNGDLVAIILLLIGTLVGFAAYGTAGQRGS